MTQSQQLAPIVTAKQPMMSQMTQSQVLASNVNPRQPMTSHRRASRPASAQFQLMDVQPVTSHIATHQPMSSQLAIMPGMPLTADPESTASQYRTSLATIHRPVWTNPEPAVSRKPAQEPSMTPRQLRQTMTLKRQSAVSSEDESQGDCAARQESYV